MTMVTVNLKEAAVSEANRLANARALTRDGDGEALAQLEAEGPWIAVARRSRLRRMLGRRALLVWRVACEDASGRAVESGLVPIAVELASAPPRPLTRAWVDAFLQAMDAEARATIEAEIRDWRAAASTIARSFNATRLARERAIASGTHKAAGHAFQSGLFDRRGERRQQLEADALADSSRDALERVAALERSAATMIRPARLLLVVVPRSC